ncbi:sensor histidine kinase [Scytonema millei]|uniref:Circadian input-output histidine kinase CikA n=1 Tax=Scytonema millei VB511283 TaxID=1245923 RepID=A0A9X5E4R6_9CYAN|nr:sensor histidine kinase [Scytonema millei]NHC33987.1 HAMP domain-containing protein [Scytonema millei VB511283]
MAKPSQSSFRRILLARILLLTVPVLLIGEAVTFRKARSSLLETARWNLTESAVNKGENISNAIAALKSNLLLASQTTVIRTGSPAQAREFLQQLASTLPNTQCLQVTEIDTGNLVASTCGNTQIASAKADPAWQRQQNQKISPLIRVQPLVEIDARRSLQLSAALDPQRSLGQLQLVLSAPVYNSSGRLTYSLNVLSALHKRERDRPGLLAGSTVVIDRNGTILAHPIANRIGRNVAQEQDAGQLQHLLKNAIAGRTRQDFIHLSFDRNGPDLLAGYNVIPSPIDRANGYWLILAVTRLDHALYGLQEIKVILVVLTIGLLVATLIAALHIIRDLARPLEKLRDYALNLQSHHAAERVPHNFKVREVEQLAEALEAMLGRLNASAAELETAWQEAQASNQMKSEFLANTSHELRTPLNAIIGCIRLVRDGCCDDRTEELEFLARADEAAIHLLGIINDLLDIARIEAGKLSVVTEALDLRQVLREAIDLQKVQIQQKGLQLIATEWQEPLLVHADAAKLKQVLINVIGNAVKFTDRGSISVKLEITAQPVQDGSTTFWVTVAVEDTGLGIDPAQQHKLFRPFVMVDGTTTRKLGGTGLGLAISRNLIELMGGRIALSSPGIGLGTTVEISLPLVDPLPSPPSMETQLSERSHSTNDNNFDLNEQRALLEDDLRERIIEESKRLDSISSVKSLQVEENINGSGVTCL